MNRQVAACRHRYVVEAVSGVSDLLALLPSPLGAPPGPLFYWENPRSGEAILARGAAHVVQTRGPERIPRASRAALEVLAALEPGAGRPAPGAPLPRFVGGFAFAADEAAGRWREFPACALFLPAQMWVLKEGRCWSIEVAPCDAAAATASTVASHAGPERDQDGARRQWVERVRRALAMIADGSLAKVVLSRRRVWRADGELSVAPILSRLRDSRPACFTFCCSFGQTRFVGSTPELLVRRQGDLLESQALAGTAARGTDARDDSARGIELLSSAKNRHEHELVIGDILAALAPVVDSPRARESPELVSLPEAHHLSTPIRGQLRMPVPVLELADRLHPTPAVCGTPRAAARALIQHEEPDRGWYTGAVGWMDAAGDGAYAVAMRAALIDGPRVTVWAGAGIVDGSDPLAEFEETELKMRVLIEAMDAGGAADREATERQRAAVLGA